MELVVWNSWFVFVVQSLSQWLHTQTNTNKHTHIHTYRHTNATSHKTYAEYKLWKAEIARKINAYTLLLALSFADKQKKLSQQEQEQNTETGIKIDSNRFEVIRGAVKKVKIHSIHCIRLNSIKILRTNTRRNHFTLLSLSLTPWPVFFLAQYSIWTF